MKEDFERLNKERRENVDKVFAGSSGKDQFFLHVLDGFSHRYITDQKFTQAEVNAQNSSYIACNKLESMKRALELVTDDQKKELIQAMKSAVGTGKPTTLFTIKIDASSLNSDGLGLVKSKCLVDWGFPNHDGTLCVVKDNSFQSEDWDHLRKHYPLMLDELCEIF